MNSEIIIIGCGHSESIRNFNNNALVRSEKGNMLIDCGHTIKHALHASGLNIGDIDAIYISHVHGDHVFGLERVAYESKFKYKKKIKLFFHSSIYEELWEQTLKGSLGKNGDGPAELGDYFNVNIINGEKFSCLGVDYKLIMAKHTPNKPAYGLLINNSTFYSTDTLALPEIINKINYSIAFHDVTLSDTNPVHATLNSLINEYSKEKRKRILLMSYEDNWEEFSGTVEKEFKGFAKQGMRFKI